MATRRVSKIPITILLLLSAVSIAGSAFQSMPVQAVAGPAITLNTSSAQPGVIIALSGTGFAAGDSIGSPYACLSGTAVSLPSTCSFSFGGAVSASFTVGSVPPGSYSVQVTGVTGDSASALLTVVTNPTITLNPTSGPGGTTVTITGSGFAPADSGVACTISGSIVSVPVCGTITSAGTMSGSFAVFGVSPGTYTVTVTATGGVGDQASASFTVTGPTITLTPNSGLPGTSVSVSGSGFNTGDTSCTITGTIVVGSPVGCAVGAISNGLLSPQTFTISNTAAPGTYPITVTGNTAGDFATATFTVTTPGPTITLNPSIGTVNTIVSVSGSGFLPSDTTCTITGSGSPAVISPNPTPCAVGAISGGILSPQTFMIAGTATPGIYTITVTGDGGDFAQAFFIVIGPSISLTPNTGRAGDNIAVSGSGFVDGDNGFVCMIQSSPGTSIVGAVACSIFANAITGGQFVVANGAAPGIYTITVTGNTGDQASASFTVLGPTIALAPASGPVGTAVTVTGSGFASTDANAPITATGPGVLSGAFPLCTISGGQIQSPCTFTVSATAPLGVYTVTATGNVASDSASATFTVTPSTPHITLIPNSGITLTVVSVSGGGFNPSDTTGTPTSSPAGLGAFPVCTISNGQLSGCTFTVSGTALPGTYTVTVTGNFASDFAAATFTVNGPTVTITPNSGPSGTSGSLSGQGFFSTDTACTTTSSPTNIFATAPTCAGLAGATGKFSGDPFTLLPNLLPGVYTIIVTGNVGADVATTTFTVTSTTPAIGLFPNSGPIGTSVVINGGGFASGDSSGPCTITQSPAAPVILSLVSVCTISSTGQLSSPSFVVAATATPGSYTITVTGTTGDFASAVFTVTSPIPIITLNPSSGPVNTVVTISGSGFNPTDAGTYACVDSTPLPDIVAVASASCTFTSGGTMSGSFTVSSTAALGAHSIRVQGTSLDQAVATFTVTVRGPKIALVPNSGPIGTAVTVTGSGFDPLDAGPCASMLSSPSNIIAGGSSCTIDSSGKLTAPSTFTVISTALPGTYVVTVTGFPTLDSAQAIFIVTTPSPSITLSPNAGPTGTVVTVSGSGFNPTDTCTGIGSNPGGLMVGFTCTISNGRITAAEFNVAAGGGTYAVIVTGSTGDSAQALFTVTAGPATISILPPSGTRGTTIAVSGTLPGPGRDTTCTISGTPVSNQICSIITTTATSTTFATTTATSTTQILTFSSFTGSFVVGSNAPGTYRITVTGNSGDSISADFTVIGPIVTITPSSAAIGVTISVAGTGFSISDTTCTVSGTGVTVAACTVSLGLVTGSFIVGNVAPGSRVITVRGSSGDSGQAVLTVLTGPSITLTPALGTAGTIVAVNGVGFLPAGTTCTITGTNNVIQTNTGACTLVAGTGTPTGSFTIANVNPGSYTITLSTNNGAGSAQAVLTVSNPFTPTIIVNPADAPGGAKITVTGTGFSALDNACQLSSSDSLLITAPACSLGTSGGVRTVTASFTVGGGASLGGKTVTVTGSTGDHASVSFTVDSTPVLLFTPSSPQPPGTVIQVTLASGRFSSADLACTISSTPTGLFSTSACVIQNTGQSLTGTFFTVSASAAAGSYAVTVKGTQAGDSAAGSFTVTSVAGLQLTPTQGVTGASVTFRATGFAPSDTGCTVQSQNGVTPDNSLIGSFTCAMSAGVATGSFVVGDLATAEKNWNVQVKGTPANDIPVGVSASFIVIPNVVVSPTAGVKGTPVAVTGTGFASTASSCTLTIAPNPSGAFSIAGCGMSGTTGHASATFTVGNAVAGVYLVSITDNTGQSAGATFTVGTPQASISITPNIVSPGQAVGVTGFGFNGGDVSCTITGPGGLILAQNCNISGGAVGGSFTVNPATTNGGLYLITVTGDQGDFASNYISVVFFTGTTTTTSTLTSSSVTTTTTAQTTTGTSSTLTTTSFTFTQASTQTSTSVTLTTIYGPSYSTVMQTVTTTQFTSFSTTATAVTTTTVSTTITYSPFVIQPFGWNEVAAFLALVLVVPFLFVRRRSS